MEMNCWSVIQNHEAVRNAVGIPFQNWKDENGREGERGTWREREGGAWLYMVPAAGDSPWKGKSLRTAAEAVGKVSRLCYWPNV